ncbi:penicillin-binding transpeptidase domain-containing protein [Nocardioides sp.]|uniref:penicillin-binding transpeptidase domain-containing protein n=1 Tax=Nocardioides sp. TaxID=35761 RepID=UPI001995A420|nr:penicillin-binding transpeptidase domain-containing protein [Nocardioides sp.]MBC7278261.1 penicillin-binding protein [Nocardioides sp.]
MTRRTDVAIICGGLVLLVLMGAGWFFVLRDTTNTYDPEEKSSEPPSAAAATKAAQAFLDAWARDKPSEAGALTDAADSATAALQSYADDLGLTKVAFSGLAVREPSSVSGTTAVEFDVAANVENGQWAYRGTLGVLQDEDGYTAVRWDHTVLHPELATGQSLVAGELTDEFMTARPATADGRKNLQDFPSLGDIAGSIRDNADGDGGRPGHGVAIVDSAGTQVKTLAVLASSKAPAIRTTIDARLQAAAEKAVGNPVLGGKPAGVVALDWRTGHILAIAYSGDSGNIAINAVKAPGSTLKIVSAAALFDLAGLHPGSAAPCPDSVLANGQTFGNDPGVSPDEGATIAEAFTVSCNTAFIKDGFNHLVNDGDASALHREATEVFGMGSWSIGGGVGTRDPSIPPDVEHGDQAAQFIGQGKVTATPLFIASIAATVAKGRFEQPIIMKNQSQARASRPISARTAGYLRTMMQTAASHGSAAPRVGDLPGVGAKTGTAEEGDHTNGWFTAYDDRIAVAALVEGGSSGVDSAGHVVRDLLTAD